MNTHKNKTRTDCAFRFATPGDVPALLRIDDAARSASLSENEFQWWNRMPNVVTLVAETAQRDACGIVGWMMYLLEGRTYTIEHVVVHPQFQRCGIGASLINYVRFHSGNNGRWCAPLTLQAYPTETNLTAQLWLRALGFRATRILPPWNSHQETRYRMQWRAVFVSRR